MRDAPSLLSIFAGIGGFDLAFHTAGFRTLAFVEWEPIKQHVLREHFPGVPIFGDIDQFDCGEFLRTHGRPDVIAGGVPCQAISLLGKRLGVADPRWKWPQTIRLVSELRPRFCVFENPPAILTAGDGEAFNGIVSAMAALGYDGMWDVIPAAAFGAGHWRERLCIVFADAQGVGKRITPDQTHAIAGGGRTRDESSSESYKRAFSSDANGERRSEARLGISEGESADEFRRQSSANSGEELSADSMRGGWRTGSEGRLAGDCEGPAEQALRLDAADPDNAGSQGHAGNGVRDRGRPGPNGSTAARHLLPDLRGRVTGPDWWHEAVTGIPVLVSGLSSRLVEAAALCIGDSVVPQAWEPIAQAIAEQIRNELTP